MPRTFRGKSRAKPAAIMLQAAVDPDEHPSVAGDSVQPVIVPAPTDIATSPEKNNAIPSATYDDEQQTASSQKMQKTTNISYKRRVASQGRVGKRQSRLVK